MTGGNGAPSVQRWHRPLIPVLVTVGAVLGAATLAVASLFKGEAPDAVLGTPVLAGAIVLAWSASRDTPRPSALKAMALGAVRGGVYGCSFVLGAGVSDSVLRDWLHLLPEATFEPDETEWEGFVAAMIGFAIFGAPIGAIVSLIGWALGRPVATDSQPTGGGAGEAPTPGADRARGRSG